MVTVAKYTALQPPDFLSMEKSHHFLSRDIFIGSCQRLSQKPKWNNIHSLQLTTNNLQTTELSSNLERMDLDPLSEPPPFDEVLPDFEKLTAEFEGFYSPLFSQGETIREEEKFTNMNLSESSPPPSPSVDKPEENIPEDKNTRLPLRQRKYKSTEKRKDVESHSTRTMCKTVANGNRRQKRGGKRQLRLWEFIRGLLESKDWTCLIAWVSKEEGTFRLLNSGAVAKMWGKTKNRTDMTYEKMSRAMRYYYAKEILLPIPQKLTYKFGDKILDEMNLKVFE